MCSLVLGPALEPLPASTSRDQEVTTDPRTSPLLIYPLGAWQSQRIPSPPHVLLGATADTETEKKYVVVSFFCQTQQATSMGHEKQIILPSCSPPHSPLHEGFSILPISCSQMLLSSRWLLVHKVLQAVAHLTWSVQANTPRGSLALENSVPFQQWPPAYLRIIRW